MKAAFSVSYNGAHNKGGDPGSSGQLPGHVHARMLRDTCLYLKRECDWPIIVGATSFPGILRIETTPDEPEREYIWDVFKLARIVSIPGNPGHQSGACWSIRMGVEAASKLGIDYLIHTAEDVVPNPGICREMVAQMQREGSDYCGEPWGHNHDELNAQFFGCRVEWFATYFDGAGVGGQWTERYMADLVYGHNRKTSLIERVYLHTHDADEHRGLIERQSTKQRNRP